MRISIVINRRHHDQNLITVFLQTVRTWRACSTVVIHISALGKTSATHQEVQILNKRPLLEWAPPPIKKVLELLWSRVLLEPQW